MSWIFPKFFWVSGKIRRTLFVFIVVAMESSSSVGHMGGAGRRRIGRAVGVVGEWAAPVGARAGDGAGPGVGAGRGRVGAGPVGNHPVGSRPALGLRGGPPAVRSVAPRPG